MSLLHKCQAAFAIPVYCGDIYHNKADNYAYDTDDDLLMMPIWFR